MLLHFCNVFISLKNSSLKFWKKIFLCFCCHYVSSLKVSFFSDDGILIHALQYRVKKLHLVKVGAFASYSVRIRVIFGVQFERRTVAKKASLYVNSILEYFEYFCQISSKSIVVVWSYTVSKFARFLRHSVHDWACCYNVWLKRSTIPEASGWPGVLNRGLHPNLLCISWCK